jgi:hypothetical protein
MAGYNYQVGMSNNAVSAYDNGLLPASKIKGIPATLIDKHCRYEEWHHSSKAFNKVKFYDEQYVRSTFGLAAHEYHEPDADAIAALAAHEEARKGSPTVHTNCTVEWIEWSGSLKRPKAEECRAEGCAVSVKGQTATITLANGTSFVKRLSTRGFKFSEVAA